MRKRNVLRAVWAWLLVLGLILQPLSALASPVGIQEDLRMTENDWADPEETESETDTQTETQPQGEQTEPVTEEAEPVTAAQTETPAETDLTEPQTETETESETEAETSRQKPRIVTDDDDSLQVLIGDAQAGFQDVDTLSTPKQITWPLNTRNKQLQIKASFSEPNKKKTRSILVTVPKGYKITEYTAKSGTTEIGGVRQLQLSEEADSKVAATVLTDLDGNSWAAQGIAGYSQYSSSTAVKQRTYSGKILYTFNSNCDQITLTLTLGLQQEILSHQATTCTLDDLEVEMTSGDDAAEKQLKTELRTTASNLVVPGMSCSSDFVIGNTSDRTAEAVTRIMTAAHSNEIGAQNHLAEKIVYKVKYPKGFTFRGLKDTSTNVNDPDGGAKAYAGGRLVAEDNTASNELTITYSRIELRHMSGTTPGLHLYWAIDMDQADEVSVKPWGGEQVIFTLDVAATITTGEGIDKSTAHSEKTYAPKVTVQAPYWNITLTNCDPVRHDLNHQGDYPYDYALGGFAMANTGNAPAENLTYEWTFNENLHIREVSFPGRYLDAVKDITATVKNSAGVTRTVTAAGPFVQTLNTSEFLNGIKITAGRLGLAADEYILNLTAKQDQLKPGNFSYSYNYSSCLYYGRFQNQSSGPVTLTVSNDSGVIVSKTSTPSIGWSNSGAGTVSTSAVKSDGTSGSWYPGDEVTITSKYTTAPVISGGQHQNDIVDPVIAISLPKGVELNDTSVEALSLAGNNGSSWFALEAFFNDKGTPKVINGVEWITYRFRAANHQDMIAESSNAGIKKSNIIQVRFKANVSSACTSYPEIKPQDVVLWDLGKTAINATAAASYVIADTHDKLGKGSSYNVVAGRTSSEFAVVQKPGLTVRLGIRTAGTSVNFFTYNNTDASIAPVTPSDNAEIWLEYENTSDSSYKVGSEIYLPVPKKNLVYGDYFNNIADDPYNTKTHKNPEYTTYLTGAVTLPGFDTLYSVDTSGTVDTGTATPSWTPVNYTFVDYATLTNNGANSENIKDVTMLKFEANQPIGASGSATSTGETTFEVEIDSLAALGQKDFWRSYQKGWREDNGEGSWVFGSIIAAEPSKAGVVGTIFEDKNNNGIKDAGEDYTNNDPGTSEPRITAQLTEAGGGTNLSLTMNADGSFETLDGAGNPYFLKAGEYTVTFTNDDETMSFTQVTSGTRSDGTKWYMDIPQANINSTQTRATFTFTVDANTNSLSTEYLGIGLIKKPVITFKAGTGVTFTDTKTAVVKGAILSGAPAIGAAEAQTGYDPSTQKWKLDKAVQLDDGSGTLVNAAAGTELTRAQLYQAVVTEDLTATAALTKYVYTIKGSVIGNKGGTITPVSDSITHGGNVTFIATAATGYELEYMKVNTNQVTPANTAGTPNYTYKVDPVTGNQTTEVKFKTISYDLTYVLAGGSNAAGNPSAYTVEDLALKLIDPTRANYEFIGWTARKTNGGTAVALDKSSPTGVADTIQDGTTGDLTLTATWKPIEYTISYDLQGGSTSGTNPAAYTVESAAITLKNPTKTGYTFTGWSGTDLTGNSNTAVTIATGSSGNRSYKANWTPIEYKIDYDLDGGSVTGTNPVKYTIESGAITLINPARTGYTFEGWTGTGLSSKTMNVTIPAGSTGDRTYDANWKVIEYRINYDLDGGSVTGTNPEKYTIESAPITLINPARTGYTFEGWSGTGLSGKTTAVTIPTGSYGDRAYTANWKAISYQVQFDTVTNGGSGTVPNQTMTYDQTAALNGFTDNGASAPAGYHFLGWNTDAAATAVLYTDKAQVKNMAGWNSSPIKLYAIYAENGNVDITYKSEDAAKGRVTPAAESLAPSTGTAAGSTAEPENGYMFGYWTDDNDNNQIISYAAAFIPGKTSAGIYEAGSYTAHFVKRDVIGDKGVIGANDFWYPVTAADGSTSPVITQDTAKELAKTYVTGYVQNPDGSSTTTPRDIDKATADSDQLEAINDAIQAGIKGKFPLIFYTEDYDSAKGTGDKVTITVTLTGNGNDDGTVGASDFSYGVKNSDGTQNSDLDDTKARVLAYAWARDNAGDFYTDAITADDAQLTKINEAKALWYQQGSSYSGEKVFDLTFTSAEAKTVTIKVTLHSAVTPVQPGRDILAADDFRYDVAGGAVDGAAVRTLAGTSLTDEYGNVLDLTNVTADAIQLAEINRRIAARELGDCPLSFITAEGLRVTITATLIGTVIQAEDAGYDIQDGELTAAKVKELMKATATDPDGNPIDISNLTLGTDELIKINERIGSRTEGAIEVTFIAPDGTSTKAVLTLRLRKAPVTVTKTAADTGAALAGAKLEIQDGDGNVIAAWTSAETGHTVEDLLIAGDTYTLKEKEAPEGYLLAEAIVFTANTDGSLLEVTMKDPKRPAPSEAMEVEVTKYVMKDGKFRSMNYSFYAALFWDEACTQRATEVKELKLNKSYTTKNTFTDLPEGTYYLAETDKDGNLMDVTSDTALFNNEIDKTAITVNKSNPREKAMIINYVKPALQDHLLEDDGVITINKTVLENDEEKAVSETFYFALFSDEEMENAVYLEALKLKKESSASLSFTDLPYGTYYIAETDKDANPIGEDFKYEVSVEQDKVTLSETDKTVTVNIENSLEKKVKPTETDDTEKETKKGTRTTYTSRLVTARGVKTGDRSPLLPYVLLFCGASAMILLLTTRRGRKSVRRNRR